MILVAQSFTFGGLAFLLLLLRPLKSQLSADSAKIGRRCHNFLRFSAFAFAFFTICAFALNAAALTPERCKRHGARSRVPISPARTSSSLLARSSSPCWQGARGAGCAAQFSSVSPHWL